MKQLIRENWIWVVTPILVVLLGLAAFLFWSDGGQGASAFTYDLNGN